jgi:hypothetical protein
VQWTLSRRLSQLSSTVKERASLVWKSAMVQLARGWQCRVARRPETNSLAKGWQMRIRQPLSLYYQMQYSKGVRVLKGDPNPMR